jgi:protein-S-isoprenylcysteine O-methyltransferase Ste14
MSLLARSLVAFIALPGMVAFAAPLAWVASQGLGPRGWLGTLPLATGAIGLLICVRDFYRAGHGTLAPWAPPERLVIVGLYRWSRNPMYLAVLCMLIGWAWLFASAALAVYAAGVAVAFHLRVVWGEEPVLARRFGDDWDRYRSRVPRWIV